ncbi:MAG: arginine--tRNA ligase [Candidatus Melainabacteria bacterium]|nr:arginine--tRNA ligase [Candidatus Melainabacteria bacterium]
MLRHIVETYFQEALSALLPQWQEASASASAVSVLSQPVLPRFQIERPRHRDHGDYAVNVASLSKWAKLPPPVIAQQLMAQLALAAQSTAETSPPALPVTCAGAFLNVRFTNDTLLESLAQLLRSQKPGCNHSQGSLRVLIEYVSANPTGPLHFGHGRWAALGDAMRRILEHSGASVTTEFYVNDFGQQMGHLARSLWFRCLEVLGKGKLPEPVAGEKYPYYPGEYVLSLAQEFLEDPARRAWIEAQWNEAQQLQDEQPLRLFARERMLALQQRLLEDFRVRFDVWTYESELHQAGAVARTLEVLRASGHTREEDGALWLKSADLGDEKDRVLVKSDGSYTYLAADIAYHADKFNRRQPNASTPQFNRHINIWGADHHGYVARMKAAVAALGHDPDALEIVLGQLVNLIVDGEKTRMGKRRRMLTLADVVEEVGVDATRFWLVSRSADNTIDFDVELAASATDENPVFYVQYAHARCAGIIRNATEPTVQSDSGERLPPRVSPERFAQALEQPEAYLKPLLDSVAEEPTVAATLREMILLLDGFEDRVADAAQLRAPHLVARYALDVASQFHSLYNACRVLTDDAEVTLARLLLIVTVRRVLAQSLDLLGVHAPDSM